MQIVKAGLLYFAVVFGTGFVLGAVRIAWLVPQVGERMAELWEMPLMLAVTIVSARWIVRKFRAVFSPSGWVAVGVLALALLLCVEFTVVLWLRGLTFADYLATRDPVSGSVYYAMLLVFAVMPGFVAWAVGRREASTGG